jgi:hypothetical protein
MVVNIFGEVEHDCQPDIVRSDLDFSMLNVGVVKGFHKSVLVWVAEMTALLVKVVLPLLPESLSVNRFLGKEFSRLK